jgi:glycosyltransferase involved in cell wall biosynthesis
MTWQGRKVLFIGHYPLDSLKSAAPVRIAALRDALAPLCDLTVITGNREQRRRPLWSLIGSGAWRQFDAVYVESATSMAMEADLLLHALLHGAGIPLGIYIRDGFPLFAGVFDDKPLKHKLLKAGWHLSMAAYQRHATICYFPSQGLAAHFHAPDRRLLPPGGTWQGDPPADRHGLVYVGEATERYGVLDILLPAAESVAATHADFHLTIVSPKPAMLAAWTDRPWLTVSSASGAELTAVLHRSAVAVVPFRRHPYMDLAVPVKLLHYMAHGLPVVVTDGPETAKIVRQADAGEVVAATPAAMAVGIRRLLEDPVRRQICSANAAKAIQGPLSWRFRAETILADLCGPSPADALDGRILAES